MYLCIYLCIYLFIYLFIYFKKGEGAEARRDSATRGRRRQGVDVIKRFFFVADVKNDSKWSNTLGNVRLGYKGLSWTNASETYVPRVSAGKTKGGKYHCTVDLFDWFGISCMTTEFFLFLFAKQITPNQSNRRSMVQ